MADPGMKLVIADSSQAEARVVAYRARCTPMIRVFEAGEDVHTAMGRLIFGKETITKQERQLAKKTVHGGNYGMGPIQFQDQLRDELGLEKSVAECKALLGRYFMRFPEVKMWQNSVEQIMNTTKTLTNAFGRTKTFMDRKGPDLHRQMLSWEPQSTIADLIGQAIRRLYKANIGFPYQFQFHLLLQVHDEIVLQTQDTNIKDVSWLLKELMEYEFTINEYKIYIPTEVKVCDNWGEAK